MYHERWDVDRSDLGGHVHLARGLDHRASIGRGGGASESIGHEPTLRTDRPAHPGAGGGVYKEVPVAIDEGHKGLRLGRADGVVQSHRAAKQDQRRLRHLRVLERDGYLRIVGGQT